MSLLRGLVAGIAAVLPLVGTALATPTLPVARDITGHLEVVSGGSWTTANTGEVVSAHGEGILQVGSTYYMVGEDKTGTTSSNFLAVNCYSSQDLVSWTFANKPLSLQPSGDLGPNRIVERPKVIYNDNTKQYVMYMHIDNTNYTEAKVGVATCSSPCGNYTYHGSFQPLGQQSRDIGLFKDPNTGAGYLLTEDRANGLRIDKLSDDYLSVKSFVYTFQDLEAPAMIYQDGLYYIFASYLSGWNFNNNVYSTAKNLSGPWTTFENFAPQGSNTFNSQTAYVLQTPNGVIYMGDRWNSNDFVATSYVWQPLSIRGTNASMMNNYVDWLPSTGGPGPNSAAYTAATGSLSGGARLISCSGCSSGQAVGYLGGPSDGTVTISNINSSDATRKTLRITYRNGDQTPRYASVSVNGGAATRLAFIPSSGSPNLASFNVALKSGASNTITISGAGDGSYAPDISEIDVPEF